MSRQSMADILIGEIYAATAHDPAKFRPIDPRRVKRLASIYEFTSWDHAETANRAIGAHVESMAFREERRRTRANLLNKHERERGRLG